MLGRPNEYLYTEMTRLGARVRAQEPLSVSFMVCSSSKPFKDLMVLGAAGREE